MKLLTYFTSSAITGRFIWPTSHGWVAMLVGCGSFAVTMVHPGFVTAMFTSVIFSILISSFCMSFLSLHSITLTRIPGLDGRLGSDILLPAKITNHSKRARQALVLHEDCEFSDEGKSNYFIPALNANEERILKRKVYAINRGEFVLSKMILIGGDPAGLFMRQKLFVEEEKIYILPAYEELTRLPLYLSKNTRVSSTGQPIGISGVGQDFYGVREYRVSDGIRFIDWKNSAKQQKLMVREFEENSVHQVSILVDCDEKYAKSGIDGNFEFLVRIAASITEYLSDLHCNLLLSCGIDESESAEGPAQNIHNEVRHILSLIQPSQTTLYEQLDKVLYEMPTGSILYCLSLHESPELSNLFITLMDRNIEVRWIHAPAENFQDSSSSEDLAASNAALQPVYVNHETKIPNLLDAIG
ncbi:MAG: DUF58 domain-containing protein [Lentisphaeria bacterium]|nr:DUF58 domain-containing protein [Lentisphaeria bacterium]NQZ66661.1 DUF58 domain-containing protein [Lentisphaeria bacterium]